MRSEIGEHETEGHAGRRADGPLGLKLVPRGKLTGVHRIRDGHNPLTRPMVIRQCPPHLLNEELSTRNDQIRWTPQSPPQALLCLVNLNVDNPLQTRPVKSVPQGTIDVGGVGMNQTSAAGPQPTPDIPVHSGRVDPRIA